MITYHAPKLKCATCDSESSLHLRQIHEDFFERENEIVRCIAESWYCEFCKSKFLSNKVYFYPSTEYKLSTVNGKKIVIRKEGET